MAQPTKQIKVIIFFFILLAMGMVSFFLLQKNTPEQSKLTETNTIELLPASISNALLLGTGYKRYENKQFGFSVEYPDTFTVEAFPEENQSATILFREEEKQEPPPEQKKGFQIFITPFGEEETITQERIQKDLPFAVVEKPQQVIINPDASAEEEIQALLFWSEDPDIGHTREVWFTKNDYLYEITTYEHLDEWLPLILSSWRILPVTS